MLHESLQQNGPETNHKTAPHLLLLLEQMKNQLKYSRFIFNFLSKLYYTTPGILKSLYYISCNITYTLKKKKGLNPYKCTATSSFQTTGHCYEELISQTTDNLISRSCQQIPKIIFSQSYKFTPYSIIEQILYSMELRGSLLQFSTETFFT